MFHLQHFQPPQSPESSFLNAADLVLVQLSVEQRKVIERMACCLQRGCPDILINHSIRLKKRRPDPNHLSSTYVLIQIVNVNKSLNSFSFLVKTVSINKLYYTPLPNLAYFLGSRHCPHFEDHLEGACWWLYNQSLPQEPWQPQPANRVQPECQVRPTHSGYLDCCSQNKLKL